MLEILGKLNEMGFTTRSKLTFSFDKEPCPKRQKRLSLLMVTKSILYSLHIAFGQSYNGHIEGTKQPAGWSGLSRSR